jgi:hypothetical protein
MVVDHQDTWSGVAGAPAAIIEAHGWGGV